MQQDNTFPKIKRFICLFAMAILFLIGSPTYAQDKTKSILDINNTKIVKKANQLLDTTQKKISNFINKRIERRINTDYFKIGYLITFQMGGK